MVNASLSNTSSSTESNGSLDADLLESIKAHRARFSHTHNVHNNTSENVLNTSTCLHDTSMSPRRIVKVIRNHNPMKPKTCCSATISNNSTANNKTLSYSSNNSSTRSTPLILRNYNLINRINHDFDFIMKSELGFDKAIFGPYGYKKLVYVDYTASSRSLKFIEDIIMDNVLINYANIHSSGIYASEQTGIFRDESREVIRKSVNGLEGLDNVLFVGSGSTAAIHKLIGILNITRENPPIVIVSPYEHHSNYLPWKELGAKIIYARYNNTSSIDLDHLERKLYKYQCDSRLKIASFTAASNVTGIQLDTDRISALLHKYGFLSFWDYSTAGPHAKIDMNRHRLNIDEKTIEDKLVYKDAVFFSGHKFLGGPQTPGVLIAKTSLFKNRVPHNCGGGTVCYVTNKTHGYIEKVEHREEGGTPAIIESIRLGLVFKFKDSLDQQLIEQRESYLEKKGIEFLSKIPNLKLLGNQKLKRYPIFSFLIQHEQTGYYLHHNFVTKLLNDLFGIQSRSGCACAGPYAQDLLGINHELADKYASFLYETSNLCWKSNNVEIFKPGFTRFNLPFFFDELNVDFVLNAVKFVAKHGWKFLPYYEFDIKTGEFNHRDFRRLKNYAYTHLNDFVHKDGYLIIKSTKIVDSSKQNGSNEQQETPLNTQLECFKEAYAALERITNSNENLDLDDQRYLFSDYQNKIRWFLLPSEAYGIINDIDSLYSYKKIHPPFTPRTY